MNGFVRLVVAAVVSATLLHALPMALAAASPDGPRCHHHDKTKPAKPAPASDVCCAVHRSAIVQPSGVPQASGHLMGGFHPSTLEVVLPCLRIYDRTVISAAPPGRVPLRI